MADNLNSAQRTSAMRQVKSKDTSTELIVRNILRAAGLVGYRLHRRDVPGCPDIAWLSKRRAIFVHGCFWHSHRCRRGCRRPKTNSDYWREKIDRNVERDHRNRAALKAMDWRVLTIWECELKDLKKIRRKMLRWLGAHPGKG
jgi:DNA mismatch endonuclease, patch repair protein